MTMILSPAGAVIVREGAALRTSDEQSLLYVEDAISLGATLSPWGLATYREARDILSTRRHIVSGDSDTEGLLFDLIRLTEQLENDLHTLEDRDENTGALRSIGYLTHLEDGYTITPIISEDDGHDERPEPPSPEWAFDGRV